MFRNWFVRSALLYRPRSWQGWLVILAAAVPCVGTFVAVDRRSHSASDTLYGVAPVFAATFLLTQLLAHLTRRR